MPSPSVQLQGVVEQTSAPLMNTRAPGGLVVMVVVLSAVIWMLWSRSPRRPGARRSQSAVSSEPPLEQVELQSGAPLSAHHGRQRPDGGGAQGDGGPLVRGRALLVAAQAAGGEVRHRPA